MLKLYLASSYGRRLELCTYRDEAIMAGALVTASWLNGEEIDTPEAREIYARTDLADIDACDILIIFTEHRDIPFRRGGKMFEAGYAYAKGKQVWAVTHAQNIFLELPEVRKFCSWKDCCESIKQMTKIKRAVRIKE
jgi:nucleoside 2-deoxyribosyltransferase